MSTPQQPDGITKPFPIFTLAHKYLIYDPNTIAHVRATHNICGVLIGTLPQAPQQNVFLGAPLELMPEEARLLVEKEVAYLVDDTKAHKAGFLEGSLSVEEQKAYHDALRKKGAAAADESSRRTEERKQSALLKKKSATTVSERKENGDWNDIPEDMLRPSMGSRKKSGTNDIPVHVDDNAKTQENDDDDDDETLFSSHDRASQRQISQAPQQHIPKAEPFAITPTTSQPPLHFDPNHRLDTSPDVPDSYPLFRHMHAKSYFLAPGMRFGCQYMAYPGDPLRFHSHFLCSGMKWDQEFDLLDIVGGGRLGTGVKKGYLIGGQHPTRNTKQHNEDNVRTFCIEWAGM